MHQHHWRIWLLALSCGAVCALLPSRLLAACGESLAAFDRRCIPAGCVAPPSNTPGILGRRALPPGRLAGLGATPDVHHGLLMSLLPTGVAVFVPRGASVQPHTQQVQGLSVWRAMRVLRFRCQGERSLIVSVIERLLRRLTQPPRFHRQSHEWREIRSTARTDSRTTKARLADRAVVYNGQSALSLDEEQQLFECLRGCLQLAGAADIDRCLDLFV
jgi:hypothetical protein